MAKHGETKNRLKLWIYYVHKSNNDYIRELFSTSVNMSFASVFVLFENSLFVLLSMALHPSRRKFISYSSTNMVIYRNISKRYLF